MTLDSVTFIGAGGVAWSLAQALAHIMRVDAVYSRQISNATTLASLTGAKAIDTPEEIPTQSSLYIVALADHAAPDVIARMPRVPSAIWALTSGSLDPHLLEPLTDKFGVFYPLQTFSRGLTVDMTGVPVFVEGSTPDTADTLMQLGASIGADMHHADATLRRKLHVAGVLTCNFVNHLWDTADTMLRADGLSLDVVRPLIEQSLSKISAITPHEAQTGPARRADMEVMRSHMSALQPDDAEMYRMLSQRIINLYHPHDESHKL